MGQSVPLEADSPASGGPPGPPYIEDCLTGKNLLSLEIKPLQKFFLVERPFRSLKDKHGLPFRGAPTSALHLKITRFDDTKGKFNFVSAPWLPEWLATKNKS